MKRIDLYTFYQIKKILWVMTGKKDKPLSAHLGKRRMLNVSETNNYIYERILDGSPFFVGRFGGFELAAVIQTLEGRFNERSQLCQQLINNAGVFDANKQGIRKFTDLYLESAHVCDLIGRHWNNMEDYIIRAYAPNTEITDMFYLEPWYPGYICPWSKALQGKKVLVIHPFVSTIQEQYKKRANIFKDSDILPDFELKTLKAVQTIAGEIDQRFDSWFDALEWMFQQSLKIDFDVAIIGCGAYGFPLAAKIKQAGKQAIHLGGASQLLFGIKGNRWEKNQIFNYVQSLFNDSWVYPSSADQVPGKGCVENGCYWGSDKTEL